MSRRNRYLDHLAKVPIFSSCTKKQLEHVARLVTEVNFEAGFTIMQEGSLAHEFVIVESGTASVKKGGRKIATIGPGDVVGELALILHRRRNATVIADSDVTMLVVDSRSFEPLLDEVPGLARRLLTTVAERLADSGKPAQLLH
jgi:CRP-like cAMP-binding protein